MTNHGSQQVSRLGSYFALHHTRFTHVFSSNLSRALKTAEAICKAQQPVPNTVQLPELREQEFGYLEGKPWTSQRRDEKDGGLPANHQDAESKESLRERAGHFIDHDLMPILDEDGLTHPLSIAVVSHGMLLSALWKCLLHRQAPGTVVVKHVIADHTPMAVEYIGGWSNAGYLELAFQHNNFPTVSLSDARQPDSDCSGVRKPSKFLVTVCAINKRDHLHGLKRTRGGVGSSKHDEGQTSIDSFFKKQRVE